MSYLRHPPPSISTSYFEMPQTLISFCFISESFPGFTLSGVACKPSSWAGQKSRSHPFLIPLSTWLSPLHIQPMSQVLSMLPSRNHSNPPILLCSHYHRPGLATVILHVNFSSDFEIDLLRSFLLPLHPTSEVLEGANLIVSYLVNLPRCFPY